MIERHPDDSGSTRGSERSHRLALLRCVRDLRLSIDRGRTMTLPNLLRLYQRRTRSGDPRTPAGLQRLRSLYLRQQPFISSRPRRPRW
jgi:hypothetical protein